MAAAGVFGGGKKKVVNNYNGPQVTQGTVKPAATLNPYGG